MTKCRKSWRGSRKNGGKAVGGGTNERDVVLVIAEQVTELLRAEGIEVDLLPATVPPGHAAEAFISIHADGNIDSLISGFKIASPRRDYSSRSIYLEESLYKTYKETTGLERDPSISRRMRGYYAFKLLLLPTPRAGFKRVLRGVWGGV